MLKYLLLILDCILLAFVTVMTIKEPPNGSDILFCTGIYIFIILHIVYIWISKTTKETWWSLYFERKRLEEKRRILSLENKDNEKDSSY